MTEGYILFARDTLANGTRDKWVADGGVAGTTPGRVNGATLLPVAVPAFDAFDFLSAATQDAGGAANTKQLLASLDFLSEGDAATADSFLAAALFQDRAFIGLPGPGNPDIRGDDFGNDYVDFGELTFRLADADWNRIKNFELFLDDEDASGVSRITVRNFVDVRVKLGDGDAATPPTEEFPFPRFISLDIQNAKRGTVDASASDFNVDLTLSTASNSSAFQNSFEVTLSALDDLFILMEGDHAGVTADGIRVRNDGGLSYVRADLGAGNDTYIGFTGAQTVRIEAGEDFGNFTVTTTASPLPELLPDFTRIDRTTGDLLVAGAGNETFVYRAGDGADEILDFTEGSDRIAIDRSLRAEAKFFQLDGNTLIVFEALPPGTPGSTSYDAGIYVEGALLGATDIVWIA